MISLNLHRSRVNKSLMLWFLSLSTNGNLSLDEDSDDDFEPLRDQDKPEYEASDELWFRRLYRLRGKTIMKDFDPLLMEKPIIFDEKTATVASKFEHSVLLTSPDHWDIGSLMTCEKIEPGYDVPADIRWVEGVTTDAESIRFVNKKIPSIPTKELIYDWIDHDWYRWFMLSRRVPGTRFHEAWPQLSAIQKLDVADGYAKHAKALAAFTSEYIETVTGQGVEGMWRLAPRESLPDWKPRIEPRVTKEEFQKYLKRSWGRINVAPPDAGALVLAHGDPTAGNIFVAVPEDPEEEAKVTAIIDWQALAYQPKWTIASTPRGQIGYSVGEQEDGRDWQWMLSNALYDAGFPLELELKEKLALQETSVVLICRGRETDNFQFRQNRNHIGRNSRR
ncbi:hypothetical protein LOCC1_G006790 [Lachnellula occidentalis]|uniref:Aminoglycoside phosphotransferase domain-containing protein n=1 Tax=Lachnellula occidentalis TaxID=215460 RepID=A0A8H8U9Q0_9HELO|nr:hypothetical protein LOCC1_G006790 [Lachnellula occidentalis]